MKTYLIGVLFFLLLTANLGLLYQNIVLRSQLTQKLPKSLKIDDKVEEFSGTKLNGENIVISYKNSKTKRVFFYFAPACEFCKEQFPIWNDLRQNLTTQNYNFYGLVSNQEEVLNIKNYLQKMNSSLLSTVQITPTIEKDYKLSFTPTTIVINDDGVVEKIWIGKWDAKVKKEAYSYFNLSS